MKHLIILIATCISLSGCGAVLVGGVATGAATAHDRRSTGTVIDDQTIRFAIIDKFNKDSSITAHSSIGVTSYNAQVLLTGKAINNDVRQAAAKHASLVAGVRRVYNEIVVGKNPDISTSSNDAWLTSRVKLAIYSIEIDDFDGTRVKVVTADSTVFLMGIVTEQEKAATIDQARHVSGVKKVVELFETK